MADLTRRDFHCLVLGSAAAALTPLTSACSGADGTVTPSDGKARCSFAQFPSLRTAGGSAIVDVKGSFPLLVMRVSDTSVSALSATCTHEYCTLVYRGSGDVGCTCHNAHFTLTGAIVSGPPRIPVPAYAATLTSDGISVDIAG